MNAIRSVGRFVSEALGDDVEVSWASDATFGRPWARVTASTGVQSTPIGAHHVERRQTFSVLVYPLLAVGEEASVMEAARVEALLLTALSAGVQDGAPLRVPLFDYSDVAVGEAASQRVGFLRVVEAPSVTSYPDPGDDRAFVVAAAFRGSWTASVQRPVTGQVVQTVGARRGV